MTDLLHALSALEADVVSLGSPITVRSDDGLEVACHMLETSGGPPLVLAKGDRVLVLPMPGLESGYILGRVSAHRTSSDLEDDCRVEVAASRPAPRVIEVVVPEGVETVRIDKRGKVVVLGTDITARARHQHKIKGASVAIN